MAEIVDINISGIEEVLVNVDKTDNNFLINIIESSGGEGVSDHALLQHLDYISSGHIGFASSNDLSILSNQLDNKVDKETGKGLSSNDYTTIDKNKLDGIQTGAEVNVNADWNSTSGDSQILNKPSIPTKVSDLTNDSGFISTETDPIFVASPAHSITIQDISTWNSKQNAYVNLTSIGSLTNANGFLRQNGSGTFSYDTNSYYLASNPNNYITSSSLTNLVPYTGATSDLNLGTHAIISQGIESAKGGIFFGQYGTFPTGLGTYVANYVSSTYGARILAYDGTSYQNLMLGKLISGTNFQLHLNSDGSSIFNGSLIATNLSGTNSGDETLSTIKNKLGAATTSSDGYLKYQDWNIFNNKQTALGFTPENSSNKGVANGYVPLDSDSKIATTYLPSVVLGAMKYKGTWDASTGNYPTSPVQGNYWVVSIAGTINSIAYKVGDWLAYNGTGWDKIDNGQTVSSVFGRTGAVSAVSGDYNTSQITENGNLYYTDARAQAANASALSNKVDKVSGKGLSTVDFTDASYIHTDNNYTTTEKNKLAGIAAGATVYTDTMAQSAISLTTNGNSGASTKSGGAINVPNYTLAGLGGISSATLTSNTVGLTTTSSTSEGVSSLTLNAASGYSIPTTAQLNNAATAYSWGNHASAGYALATGTNATGTWPISISGTAANATKWGGVEIDASIPLGGQITSIPAFDGTNVVKPKNSTAVQSWLGLGSMAYGTISGTSGYIPKFGSSNSFGNSLIFDDGSNIGIGTTSPIYLLGLSWGYASSGTNIFIKNNRSSDTWILDGAYNGGIIFGNNDADNHRIDKSSAAIRSYPNDYGQTGDLRFYTSVDGAANSLIEKFRINGDGTANLTGTLTIPSVVISGGSPSAGKVLTATDANGNCTWQTPGYSSGTYTPTATNLENVSECVPSFATYIVIGDIIHVSGGGYFTPSATTFPSFCLSLPIQTTKIQQENLGTITQDGHGHQSQLDLSTSTKILFVFTGSDLDNTHELRFFYSYSYSIK